MIVALLTSLALAATPNPSFHELPLSNGFGAAVVEDGAGKLTTFLTHPYAEQSAGVLTADVLFDSYGGVAIDGQGGIWLGETSAASVEYVTGTGLVEVLHVVGPVSVRTVFFAPWDLQRPAVVLAMEATNTDPIATHTVTLAALSNFHLGAGAPEASELGERLERVAPGVWLEGGTTTDHRVAYRAWPEVDHESGTPDNPYPAFKSVGVLAFPAAVGEPVEADDAVVGFARGPVTLAPGESLSLAVVAAYGTSDEEAMLVGAIDDWIAQRPPEQLLSDEVSAWDAWLAMDTLAAQLESAGAPLTEDELAVWCQGLAVVRMSQVREPNSGQASPNGQILASLPPGMWNRAWPRDGAYATAMLARVGYLTEAWDALSFVLDADAGYWVDEVGAPYLVSVARYFGDGTEESDLNEFGPNIEFDDFGLFLWALGEWVDAGGDLALVAPYWSDVRALVADVLVGLIEPATGLLRPDSSIWEVHWDGQQKHFTYSNAAGVAGLCAAARVAEAFGEATAAAAYAESAVALRDAMVEQLVDPNSGGIAGNLEELETGSALDAAAVEVINWGLVAPDSLVADATLTSFETLRIAPDRGFARNDDVGWYDQQEWVFIDLRVAAAYAMAGQPAKAAALIEWVVAQTRANHDLIAELYAVEDARYEGAIPMAGYGAGALALARLPARPIIGPNGCLGLAEPATEAEPVEVAEPPEVDAMDASMPEVLDDISAVGPTPDASAEQEVDAPPATEVLPGHDAVVEDTASAATAAAEDAVLTEQPPGPSGSSGCHAGGHPLTAWLLALAAWLALSVGVNHFPLSPSQRGRRGACVNEINPL